MSRRAVGKVKALSRGGNAAPWHMLEFPSAANLPVNLFMGMVKRMNKELLQYLAGLCQAASAALLASAVIMPDMRNESLFACGIAALSGALAIIFKERVR